MSLRMWSRHACIGALVILLVGCGGSSSTAGVGGSGSSSSTGSSGNNTGGSGSNPTVTGVSTPKSVSVVTAN